MAFSFNRFILCGAALCSLCNGLDGGDILCKIQKHSFQGRELSVNPDETVSLNCSVVQGKPARQIRWSKEGDNTNGQRLLNVSSFSMPGLWTSLRLNNVSVEESGTYKCEVKKETQRDVCKVVLHVYSRPRILKTKGFFTTTPQFLTEGRNPVFHCYASGWPKPSFAWRKDGKEINDGDALNSYVLTKRAFGLNAGLDLDILYVRQEHAGRYSCVAKNVFGEQQHNINLFIKRKHPGKPPKVYPYASVNQVTIQRREDARLTCVGENTPNIDTVVSWVFNGKSLPLDKNKDSHHVSDFVYFQEQDTLKVNFSLLIRNVTERDTGAYHCGVHTLKGNDSDTIYLSLFQPGSKQVKRKASLTEILLVGAGIFCGLVTAAVAHRQWSRRRRHWKRKLLSYRLVIFLCPPIGFLVFKLVPSR
ncbi:contactin-6-like [Oculina patagonica]